MSQILALQIKRTANIQMITRKTSDKQAEVLSLTTLNQISYTIPIWGKIVIEEASPTSPHPTSHTQHFLKKAKAF